MSATRGMRARFRRLAARAGTVILGGITVTEMNTTELQGAVVLLEKVYNDLVVGHAPDEVLIETYTNIRRVLEQSGKLP